METEINTNNKIDLRSEKVRQLIGEIPPALVRWSMAIIVIVFIVLIAAVCVLQYPYLSGESILQNFIE